MYSRVTLLEIDTMRVDIDDAAALFRAHVAPGLRSRRATRAQSRSSHRRGRE